MASWAEVSLAIHREVCCQCFSAFWMNRRHLPTLSVLEKSWPREDPDRIRWNVSARTQTPVIWHQQARSDMRRRDILKLIARCKLNHDLPLTKQAHGLRLLLCLSFGSSTFSSDLRPAPAWTNDWPCGPEHGQREATSYRC